MKDNILKIGTTILVGIFSMVGITEWTYTGDQRIMVVANGLFFLALGIYVARATIHWTVPFLMLVVFALCMHVQYDLIARANANPVASVLITGIVLIGTAAYSFIAWSKPGGSPFNRHLFVTIITALSGITFLVWGLYLAS